MKKKCIAFVAMVSCISGLLIFLSAGTGQADTPGASEYEAYPSFQSGAVPPLVMLVMGRDHKLYYSAYNDASDLNGDGTIDTRYNPEIDYYGYFDSYKYYAYSTTNKRFEPKGVTTDKKKIGSTTWSGDFLNYLTMSRMDTLRKVLYGGMRSTDTSTETVLQRAYIPQDAHSWGKEYTSEDVDGYKISDYTPLSQPTGTGRRHLFASTTHTENGDPLLLVLANQSYRIWEWVAKESPVAGNTIGIDKVVTLSGYTYNLVVRVKVADPAVGVESNCKLYPSGAYKPIGLLQRHGENDGMYFGLLSGSYTKNMSGGVVRKNIGSIKDEINLETGQFSSTVGIIQTINRFRISQFSYSNRSYGSTVWNRAMNEAEFPDWGNPIAEMMYETLRYFSVPTLGPTTAYNYTGSTSVDNTLGLPKVTSWTDPFIQSGAKVPCAKPIMLVISDINPSYDSDQLPGSAFYASGWNNAVTLGARNLSVYNELGFIDDAAVATNRKYYIGQSGTAAGSYDAACTAKSIVGLTNLRGLCPEEPTKEGSYYAGAVAHFGRNTDLRTDAGFDGPQNISTYAVALSSPLPKIEIPVGGHTITLTPVGKTVVSGVGGVTIDAREGKFQPTCTIAGFFVEALSDDKKSGKFRINYEDAEQGGDHDMDVIVSYAYQVSADDQTVDVTVTKEYQAAGHTLHLGYIISGTEKDGIYLEVASKLTNGDNSYYLDTPADRYEPGRGNSRQQLTDGSHTRTFTPSGNPAATLLENPLWFAARWGGVADGEKWDKKTDGTPDNYFFVINPLELETKLNETFQAIAENAASGTASSVLANNSEGEATILQAYFRPKVTTPSGDLSWLGYLQSLWVDSYGNLREDSNSNGKLDLVNTSAAGGSTQAGDADKIIEYASDGVIHRYTQHYRYHSKNQYNASCVLEHLGIGTCDTSYETISFDEVTPIFEAGKKLHQRDAADRTIYTWVDTNWTAGGTSAPEQKAFSADNLSLIRPFLGVQDNAAWTYLHTGSEKTETARATTLINYIRGTDFSTTRSRTLDGKAWKLGDIINSTPVSVSGPPDNYHLAYSDRSFQDYLNTQKNRETVVYVGANDGMLHAFTSWKYDSSTGGTYTRPGATTEELGDELWAYIPQALLPHLKFLADPDYGHSFYVDLNPKVFDAQIDDEWRTLLLVGLNMGGKQIPVTENGYTRTFNPTYTCIDVTDPRAPKVLWERSYDNLAMTTSTPAIVVVGKEKTDGKWNSGKWLAVFGSGPTGYDGVSGQNGYIFAVDVATGEPFKNPDTNKDWLFDTGVATAVMGSPTPYDNNLTYNVDAVYLGSAIGGSFDADKENASASTKGAVIKINTHGTDGKPSADPTDWKLSTLFQAPGPITAPVALSTDHTHQVWAFFGTGRYLSTADKVSSTQQYFYGIKDPYYQKKGTQTDGEVTTDTLYDATKKEVKSNNLTAWNQLLDAARSYDGGWYYKLDSRTPSERVVSKASLLGGIVFFPTYVPNADVCGFGGETYFYALYYETGTAYYKPVIDGTVNAEDGTIADRIFAGIGAPPPSAGFHIGSGTGATAFLQLSTGQVFKVDIETAFSLKSAITGWRDKTR